MPAQILKGQEKLSWSVDQGRGARVGNGYICPCLSRNSYSGLGPLQTGTSLLSQDAMLFEHVAAYGVKDWKQTGASAFKGSNPEDTCRPVGRKQRAWAS